MSGVTINLIRCEDVIDQDIRGGFSQKSVALTYAMTLKSQAQGAWQPDWKRINEAIIAKWSIKALNRIKKRAWAICEGRIQP